MRIFFIHKQQVTPLANEKRSGVSHVSRQNPDHRDADIQTPLSVPPVAAPKAGDAELVNRGTEAGRAVGASVPQ